MKEKNRKKEDRECSRSKYRIINYCGDYCNRSNWLKDIAKYYYFVCDCIDF